MLTVAIVSVYSVQAACYRSELYNIKTLIAQALYRCRNYNTLLKSVDRTA